MKPRKRKYLLFILIIIVACMCAVFFKYKNTKPNEVKEEVTVKEQVTNVVTEPSYKEPNIEEYHISLDETAKANNVYGMQVVVFKDQEILDSYNYGYSDQIKKTEVNDSTVFRIASTSKMISNMLIMKLVDEGKISLDSNLKEVTGLHYNEKAKLYQLLTHTAGIADNVLFNENLDKVYDINYLLDISNVSEPGEEYRYTNFGAGTMAAIVECLTGEYFMDYAQRELFDYLDLNAAYVCEYLDEGTDVAKMYIDGEVYDPKTWIYNYDFYRSFKLGKQYRLAYGNMYSSASDLAKLGMVLVNNGYLGDKFFLSYNALSEIRTIRNEAPKHNYIMGLNTDLFLDMVDGRKLYGHTGSAYGALSTLLYDPSDNTGIVILTNHALNSKNDKGYTELFYDIVNRAYDEFFTLVG